MSTNGGGGSSGSGGLISVGSRQPSATQRISDGGGEELRVFMLNLGLSTHLGCLTKAEVLTMEDLALMSDADLREVGLAKGPRLRILDGLAGRGLGGGGGGGRSGKCKVCLDRPVQTVLKPCGHSLMCTVCAQSVQQCPVCRQKIEETIRWFPTW
mmetsp:Transcript_11671/g.28314  ORF Transcript_11671/g.28314 Transcript_11671/m.28314 type:complete len:155 (-) Transcript_11671:915-1379(-)